MEIHGIMYLYLDTSICISVIFIRYIYIYNCKFLYHLVLEASGSFLYAQQGVDFNFLL